MKIRIFSYLTILWFVMLFEYGCATLVPDTTLYLGEVAHIPFGDEVEKGVQLGSDKIPPPTQYHLKCTNELNKNDTYALVRFSYFWTRAGGDVHNDVSWVVVPESLRIRQGNIVELNIARSKIDPNFQCPLATSIYLPDFNSGACEYRLNERGISGTIVDLSQITIGGRGSASIYCENLEKEGWKYMLDGPEKARVWKKNFQ